MNTCGYFTLPKIGAAACVFWYFVPAGKNFVLLIELYFANYHVVYLIAACLLLGFAMHDQPPHQHGICR